MTYAFAFSSWEYPDKPRYIFIDMNAGTQQEVIIETEFAEAQLSPMHTLVFDENLGDGGGYQSQAILFVDRFAKRRRIISIEATSTGTDSTFVATMRKKPLSLELTSSSDWSAYLGSLDTSSSLTISDHTPPAVTSMSASVSIETDGDYARTVSQTYRST